MFQEVDHGGAGGDSKVCFEAHEVAIVVTNPVGRLLPETKNVYGNTAQRVGTQERRTTIGRSLLDEARVFALGGRRAEQQAKHDVLRR